MISVAADDLMLAAVVAQRDAVLALTAVAVPGDRFTALPMARMAGELATAALLGTSRHAAQPVWRRLLTHSGPAAEVYLEWLAERETSTCATDRGAVTVAA